MYCGAGSETALNKQSKQAVISSSMTPIDVHDISSRPETTNDVPESCQQCQEPYRKGGDTAKVIIIPTGTKESGVYAVINKKTGKAKSFPL